MRPFTKGSARLRAVEVQPLMCPDPGDGSREIQAHIAAMFEKAPSHFSVDAADFRLVAFNAAFARHMREEYGIELRAGMGPEELLPEGAAQAWRGLYQRALREGAFQTDYTSVSGSRHMLLRFERLERGGLAFGISVLAVDVTEGRLAVDALAEARERLAAIVESTEDLIFSVDPERFGLLTFNGAFARHFKSGMDLDIRVGMTPSELLPPPFAAAWCAFYERLLREGPFSQEYETAAGGRTLLLSFNRLEREGRLFAIAVFGQDITVRKEAERRLAASEARFRALIEDSPVAVGVCRQDLSVDYVNDRYAALLGTKPDALVGQPLLEQWAPDSRAELSSLIARVRTQKEVVEFESLARRADGAVFPVHAAIAVLRRSEDPLAVIFLTDISQRKAVETRLNETLRELQALRDRLQADNLVLRQQVVVQHGAAAILGQSAGIRRVVEHARTVAPTDAAVLITGETGTGKELLAQAIHQMSRRAARPMVTVNCAALPAELIESELFGREKGAYTGASTLQKGRFEAADGSTLFLDEVADLPLELQPKLLRVLQDGRFERLGGSETLSVDVRVIAATNQDLRRLVASGRFREDLLYRLRVFPIEIPPLRTRPEDIGPLAWDAVRSFSKKLGKAVDSIAPETLDRLQAHGWPGNVRELRNVIERAVILSSGPTLSVDFHSDGESAVPPLTLEDAQRGHVLAILEQTGWRIAGRGGAAELLGLRRSTLNSLTKRLGITRPRT